MSPVLAAMLFAIGIAGLFFLDRDQSARTSAALWIPVIWIWINGSRPVSVWLQMSTPLDSPDQYLEGSPIDRVVFAVLLGLAAIVVLRRGRQVLKLIGPNWPIVLFFAYCGASVFWSDFPDVAFKRWTKAVGDLLMLSIVLTEKNVCASVKRLLNRAAFILIPLSVLFIKYYPALGRGLRKWVWVPTHTGVTTNKNLLGMICLIFGIGSVWRLLAAYYDRTVVNRSRQLLTHASLIAMIIWLLWMANSMTPLACLVLASGLLAMTTLTAVARKPAIVHCVVITTICVACSTILLGSNTTMLQAMGRDSTLTGRTTIWHQLLQMTVNPVLGTGFESFWLGPRLQNLWTIFGRELNEAHNGYLEVFLNLGWAGVSLLGIVIVTGYRNVLCALRRDADEGRLRLAYFVAALVYSFTEAGFRMMDPVWIFFLLSAAKVPQPWTAREVDQPVIAETLEHAVRGQERLEAI